MKKKRLGVNIDHIATIRNARGEYYPEPLKAAKIVQESGGDSVTIHLREDRRHIRDLDLKLIIIKVFNWVLYIYLILMMRFYLNVK